MRAINKWFLCALLTLLVGCASLGLEKPQTFTERLAYGYAQHTAVLQGATSSLSVGAITADDAERILKESDSARVALDAARVAAGSGDVGTAEGRLAFAITALTQLQAYLHSKAGPQ